MRIAALLSHQDRKPLATIGSGATLRDVVAGLAEANVGALVVSDDGEHLLGIVTERDVVRRLAEDASALDSTVESQMTRDVDTAGPEATVEQLMSLMTAKRFRHVPVLKDDVLQGVVSIGDLVKARIDELEFERDQLGSYVQG